MKKLITRFPLKQFSFFLGVLFSLASCQELEAEKPNGPKQIVDATRSTVTGTGGEVGVAHAVRVRLVNARGFGLTKIVPQLVGVNGSGAVVAGVVSGGCSATDELGYSNCTVTSSVAGTYNLKVTSPVVFTGGAIAFTQITRSLRFVTQPSTAAVSGTAFATQPTVELLDRVGTRNATGTDTVTLSLTVPGTAVISGVVAQAGVAGLATFAGLSVNIAGTYTFTAASGSATSVASDSFTITAGTASKLGFTTQPSSSTAANIAFATQPIVAVQDAAGNTVSSSCTITISLSSPNGGSDSLAGTSSRAALAGVSNFAGAGLRVLSTIGGTTYTITATGSGGAGCAALTTATSSAFTITLAGVPALLSLRTSPGNASLGQVWPTQPVIEVLDAFGNLVSGDNTTVVTIAKTGASPAGPLAGSLSLVAVNGTVTFNGLEIDSAAGADAGTYGYTFTGVYPGVTIPVLTWTGQAINANGLTAPFSLRFSVQPQNSSLGATMPAITVQQVDANGFLNTSDNTTVVTIARGSGSGTLTGTLTQTLLGGQATFSDLAITTLAGNHTLTATPSTIAATSNFFAIASFSTASRLAFTNTVVGGANPWGTQPIVAVQDSAGNTVANDNSTQVRIGISSSIGGTTTLTGTATRTVVNGVATFTDLGTLETGRTAIIIEATATNATLTSTQSNTFNGAP
jgi:hypothetical protein